MGLTFSVGVQAGLKGSPQVVGGQGERRLGLSAGLVELARLGEGRRQRVRLKPRLLLAE